MMESRQKFDPLDLEIIERVYEAACAYIEAKNLYCNANQTAGEEDALRRSIFALADTGTIDFDILCDKVISVANADDRLRTRQEPPSAPLAPVPDAA